MQKRKVVMGVMAGMALVGALGVAEKSYAYTPTAEEEAAVESVMDELKGVYQGFVDEYNTEHSGNHIQVKEESSNSGRSGRNPLYKTSLADVYTPINPVSYFTIRDSNGDFPWNHPLQGKPVASSLGEKLDDLGFSFEDYLYYRTTNYYQSQYIDEDTGVICALYVADDVAEVGCGHTNWQTIPDEWKDYLSGVGKAYYDAMETYLKVDESFEEPPIIHNSEYGTYQYTFVDTPGNDIKTFYRSGNDSEWVYSPLGSGAWCSAYSGEIAKGLAGVVCMNDDYTGGKVVYIEETEDVAIEEEEGKEEVKEETKKESGVKAPETGALTDGDGGSATAITTSAVIVLASMVLWLASYAKGRIEGRVRLEKK